MRELSTDIETFSSVDLNTAGVYKYVASPDFDILMISYAFDDEPIKLIDLTSQSFEDAFMDHEEYFWALEDPTIVKTAYNATFEILCLSKRFGLKLDYNQWVCTMVKASLVGLPTGLFATGIALGLETTKDVSGKELIKFFCMPCKPTKTNGMRTRNLPHHAPDKWLHFCEYCKGDTHQERLIKDKLKWYNISEDERLIWKLDAKINETGVELDPVLIAGALKIAAEYEEKCMAKAIELTGLANPKSPAQIKAWLSSAIGEEIESLNKKSMPDVLKQIGDDNLANEVLKLRGELSKTSVKKYDAMLRCIMDDLRARGLLQYNGASRTKRWAGRLIQVQNLKRNTMDQLDLARELTKQGDYEGLEMIWDSPPDVLSQLIRTAFVAPKGKVLASADFSAIEARITAWLAGEKWRLDVFSTHGKIYEASASTMFKVPLDTIVKGGSNYHLRQNGKVSELALGFGGGPDALIKMGALDMDFMKVFIKKVKTKWIEVGPYVILEQNMGPDIVLATEQEFVDYYVYKELAKLVKMWRNASPSIVKYWKTINECAIEAIQNPGMKIDCGHGISYQVKDKRLWCILPSGGHLVYLAPKLIPGKFEGSVQIAYSGVDQFTKKFTTQTTYGGKLVENIVQATARDLLAYAMLDLDRAGFKIVMHVHDEVVIELDEATVASDVLRINQIMAKGFPWSKGLPLGAETTISKYYKKE